MAAQRFYRDAKGRWRDRAHGNRFASRSDLAAAGVTPKESTPMKRETTVKGGCAQRLSASIPLVVEAEPDIAAAWTIAEGIVDALSARNGLSQQEARAKAAAMYARAHGIQSEADTVEHQFGEALAEALVYVLVHRGLSWEELAPPELSGDAEGWLDAVADAGVQAAPSIARGIGTAIGAGIGAMVGQPVAGAAMGSGVGTAVGPLFETD